MNTSAPETVVTRRPAGKSAPRRTGLRREIGFIGLLWASAGSIIGSGWLFGAQKALIARRARGDHLLGDRRARRSSCSP